MAQMVRHIEGLLTAPTAGALSFVVIVPGWLEMDAWSMLQVARI
jgi:hypothetical protein